MGNFGSMYEMFPSEKYFDSLYADKTYLVTSFVGIGDLVISTYADTRQRLNSYLPHYNAALADSAEEEATPSDKKEIKLKSKVSKH